MRRPLTKVMDRGPNSVHPRCWNFAHPQQGARSPAEIQLECRSLHHHCQHANHPLQPRWATMPDWCCALTQSVGCLCYQTLPNRGGQIQHQHQHRRYHSGPPHRSCGRRKTPPSMHTRRLRLQQEQEQAQKQGRKRCSSVYGFAIGGR